MNKKIHLLALMLLFLASLASCSSDSFKIDGELAHVDGGRVKVVMRGDSGMVDEWVDVDKKGHFTFSGAASQPALVVLMNHNGEVLTTVVAANGDHIKVKGNAAQPMGVKVKGSKVNEDWQMFRDEHLDFYLNSNPARLDAAIEKYVRENPRDMLSTVLLIADYSDYSDRANVEKLLKSIDISVRPETLTDLFRESAATAAKRHQPRLMTLELYKHGAGFEKIKLSGQPTLLYLWTNPLDDVKALNPQLRDFAQDAERGARFIDILCESDTMRWHHAIAGEPWQHYWAPGGPMEKGIQVLGATTMPWYAVTDSTGLVIYSGPSIDQAIHSVTGK